MKSATALAQVSPEAGAREVGAPLSNHWGGPAGLPLAKVSPPLAVTATEAALEDYRRSQRLERVRNICLSNMCSPEAVSVYLRLTEYTFVVGSIHI